MGENIKTNINSLLAISAYFNVLEDDNLIVPMINSLIKIADTNLLANLDVCCTLIKYLLCWKVREIERSSVKDFDVSSSNCKKCATTYYSYLMNLISFENKQVRRITFTHTTDLLILICSKHDNFQEKYLYVKIKNHELNKITEICCANIIKTNDNNIMFDDNEEFENGKIIFRAFCKLIQNKILPMRCLAPFLRVYLKNLIYDEIFKETLNICFDTNRINVGKLISLTMQLEISDAVHLYTNIFAK